MDTKRSAEVRGMFTEALEKLQVGEFQFVGMTKEGALFESAEGHVVVKAVVKKETFDAEDALDEYVEAQERAAERAAKAKAKAEKAAREKAEKE